MARLGNVIEKTLSYYRPEDGPYIDLVAFGKVIPFVKLHFWESCLLGCGVASRSVKTKRLPLLGRLKTKDSGTRGSMRVVVLSSSLREWLEHYNPDKERSVDSLMEELESVSRRYEQYLRYLHLKDKVRNGTAPKKFMKELAAV